MSKTQAKGPKPLPKPSAAEIADAHFRAYSQQMQSIAKGILYNSLHCEAPHTSAEGIALVDRALEMAAHYMQAAGPAVAAAFEKQMALAAEEAAKQEAEQ